MRGCDQGGGKRVFGGDEQDMSNMSSDGIEQVDLQVKHGIHCSRTVL